MNLPDPSQIVAEARLPAGSALGCVLDSELQRLGRMARPAGCRRALGGNEAGPFEIALRRDRAERGIAVIAEYKRASPKLGPFAAGVQLEAQLEAYEVGGATCISVLAEAAHFHGGAEHVRRASRHRMPLLYKGFVLAESQLAEATLCGASAVLLIARVLQSHTALFAERARSYGLEPLVELHDTAEAVHARAAGARLIGYNARDLATFAVQATPAGNLRRLFPDAVLIRESGIANPAEARAAAADGFDAVLIGEALMRSPSPLTFLRAIFAEGTR